MEKKILIVDDESDIQEIVKEHLISKNYNVITASNPDEALKLIPTQKFDLILSDINMPEKSGLDLYEEFKMNESADYDHDIPFVLMTGYADIISVKNAFSIGISELIAKPFDLEAVGLVVDYLLKNERSVGPESTKYFSVSIEDFIISKKSDYNVFLKIDGKFLRVTKSGQDFTQQRIENFARKGVTTIYLGSEDFARYTDLQFVLASSMSLRPMDVAVKAKVMNHLMSSVTQSFISNHLSSEFFKNSLTAFESYTQVSLCNAQVSHIMNQLLTESPTLAERSTAKAMICSAVAGMWKWISPKAQSRIILAALLCDVGLKDNPHLISKKKVDLNSDERKTYEQHPMLSFEILKEVQGIPEEILFVALQHHENMAGLGFPQKLNKTKTHAYSKLVHGVGEFIDTLYIQDDKANVQMALDSLFSLQNKIISEQVLKSLYLLFNAKMPKQLNALLLPTETYRVA